MLIYTAAQCVPPCDTVRFKPPNNAPISVHQNVAAGFFPPANGLGSVPQPTSFIMLVLMLVTLEQEDICHSLPAHSSHT